MSYRSKLNSQLDTQSDAIPRVAALADAGRFKEALHLLETQRLSLSESRNARGVCLMRMQRYREALELYKSFVIPVNCTWMNPELPVIYRTNMVTALLLAGLPQGGQTYLLEIQEQNHPSVVRLRKTLGLWTSKLSWWKWLQWKCGLDVNETIPLDFFPGDFLPGDFLDPATVELVRQADKPKEAPLPATAVTELPV